MSILVDYLLSLVIVQAVLWALGIVAAGLGSLWAIRAYLKRKGLTD